MGGLHINMYMYQGGRRPAKHPRKWKTPAKYRENHRSCCFTRHKKYGKKIFFRDFQQKKYRILFYLWIWSDFGYFCLDKAIFWCSASKIPWFSAGATESVFEFVYFWPAKTARVPAVFTPAKKPDFRAANFAATLIYIYILHRKLAQSYASTYVHIYTYYIHIYNIYIIIYVSMYVHNTTHFL